MKDDIVCPRCSGRGRLPDPAKTGAAIRALRIRSGISLRKAAIECGVSAPQLGDLELGRCGWTNEMHKRVKKAIKTLSESTTS